LRRGNEIDVVDRALFERHVYLRDGVDLVGPVFDLSRNADDFPDVWLGLWNLRRPQPDLQSDWRPSTAKVQWMQRQLEQTNQR